MRSIRTVILFTLASGLAAGIATDLAARPVLGQPDARDILLRIDSLQALVEYESATIEMRLFDGERLVRNRTLELKTANTDGVKKALAVFISPADIRGMSLLTVETGAGIDAETDQQLYLPSLRRVQRITGSRRQERFAGSDFSFEDLRARKPDEYESTILEKKAGEWTLAMTPSDSDSPYSRIEVVIDSMRLAVIDARYFDRGNRLIKTLHSSNFAESKPGVWKPATLVMTNVQENRRTELYYRERDTNTPIPPETFTERQLRRGF